MLTCLLSTDSETAYVRYVHECIMVAEFGASTHRVSFVRRHRAELGRLGSRLLEVEEELLEAAFADAVRSRGVVYPRTLTGLRLAVPRWYVRRVPDPLRVWEEAASFRPTGLAVDPMCQMLVDPGSTPFRVLENGEWLYFCCAHCLAVHGDRVLRSA